MERGKEQRLTPLCASVSDARDAAPALGAALGALQPDGRHQHSKNGNCFPVIIV